MTILKRNREIDILVIGLAVILLILTILTYILDQKKANWICGPVLLLMEFIALCFQTLLSVLIWKTKKQKIKVTLLVLSIFIVVFITFGFVNFTYNCT